MWIGCLEGGGYCEEMDCWAFVWIRYDFRVYFVCMWDFAPLVVIVVLISCFIVFYVVVVYYASKLLKLLIMNVNNLLVTLWVGNSGGMKYFL